MGDEYCSVSIRQDECLSEILLEHGSQHKGKHQRRGFVVCLAKDIPYEAKQNHYPDIEDVTADTVSANEAEEQYQGKEDPVWDLQDADPDADERKIENKKHHIADIHASYSSPKYLWPLRNHEGTWP